MATGVQAGTGQPLTIINNGASGLTTLALSGTISAATAGSAFNVSGWSNTRISGTINNTIGTLTKDGPGVLNLESARRHAYTGGTFINGGTVRITDNNQLGAVSGGVTSMAARCTSRPTSSWTGTSHWGRTAGRS